MNILASPDNRPRWIGFKTLVRRECTVMVRFWSVTLAPPAVMTVLYFAVFGRIMGQRIGGVSGIDYVHYLAPGLILLWVIPYSFGHTAAGLLGARSFKFIEELLVSPMPDWVVMIGYVVSGMIRGVLVGIIAGIATLLFVRLNIHSVFVGVLVLSLTAFVAALGGFITGLFAKSFDQVTLIRLHPHSSHVPGWRIRIGRDATRVGATLSRSRTRCLHGGCISIRFSGLVRCTSEHCGHDNLRPWNPSVAGSDETPGPWIRRPRIEARLMTVRRALTVLGSHRRDSDCLHEFLRNRGYDLMLRAVASRHRPASLAGDEACVVAGEKCDRRLVSLASRDAWRGHSRHPPYRYGCQAAAQTSAVDP